MLIVVAHSKALHLGGNGTCCGEPSHTIKLSGGPVQCRGVPQWSHHSGRIRLPSSVLYCFMIPQHLKKKKPHTLIVERKTERRDNKQAIVLLTYDGLLTEHLILKYELWLWVWRLSCCCCMSWWLLLATIEPLESETPKSNDARDKWLPSHSQDGSLPHTMLRSTVIKLTDRGTVVGSVAFVHKDQTPLSGAAV